jgi:hypothetical protein
VELSDKEKETVESMSENNRESPDRGVATQLKMFLNGLG